MDNKKIVKKNYTMKLKAIVDFGLVCSIFFSILLSVMIAKGFDKSDRLFVLAVSFFILVFISYSIFGVIGTFVEISENIILLVNKDLSNENEKTDSWYCPKCGKEMKGGSFCSICGEKK